VKNGPLKVTFLFYEVGIPADGKKSKMLNLVILRSGEDKKNTTFLTPCEFCMVTAIKKMYTHSSEWSLGFKQINQTIKHWRINKQNTLWKCTAYSTVYKRKSSILQLAAYTHLNLLFNLKPTYDEWTFSAGIGRCFEINIWHKFSIFQATKKK
jgi:hypothetical protein